MHSAAGVAAVQLADQIVGCKALKAKALRYIAENFKEVATTQEFMVRDTGVRCYFGGVAVIAYFGCIWGRFGCISINRVDF